MLGQLVAAAQGGFLRLNAVSGHLARPRGACLFCPMLEIGQCDYEQELQPVSLQGALMAASATAASVMKEKAVHMSLLEQMPSPTAAPVWKSGNDTNPEL